jgi:hypothetical protein
MLTYLNLSENNFIEIDLNVETVLKVCLDGDITTRRSENKIEYLDTHVTLTVNTTQKTLEINSESIRFKVSYCDFPEAPEVLAEIMTRYMSRR